MIVIVMGVTGAGKTTVGRLLARDLGSEFADADDFHPAANVQKMARGVPLTDADRAPWLESLHEAIVRWLREGKNVVLACSALKRAYCDKLGIGPGVQLVYLQGSRELIGSRLRHRFGHFATESILADQFATLEEPENAITVGVGGSPEEIVHAIREALKL